MIKLSAKLRKETGKKVNAFREAGRIPAVIYGHKVKNTLLDLDYREFQNVFKETGENSLIELNIEGDKEKRPVLVHDLQRDPISDKFIHIDFFQTSLTEEVEVEIPLVFEGTSLAVKDLGGTLVKSISELKIKSLPQNIPHQIVVSIDGLNTFEDHILVKDLPIPKDVKVMAKPDEIVVSVSAPTNIEAELETPIEEKVEDVEKVGKKEAEAEVVDDAEPKEEAKPAPKTSPDKKAPEKK